MKEFVEGAVTTNGVTLHYWRYVLPVQTSTGLLSRGKPRLTLMLLHNITDDSRCWGRVAEALRPNYDLVVPDSRGHGLSEGPESGYGIEDRASDVAGLIESLQLDRPVLVGHGMGAETAIGAAAIYPALVRAVVLEEPPWPGRFYGSTPEERAERAAKWREEIVAMRSKSKKDLLELARQQNPSWPEEEVEPWADAKRRVNPDVTNIVFAPRRRWSDYLRETECPLLAITADPARGAIVSEQTIREAGVFWKNGRAVNIPDAGHNIHREQLEAYVKAVRGFLDKQVK